MGFSREQMRSFYNNFDAIMCEFDREIHNREHFPAELQVEKGRVAEDVMWNMLEAYKLIHPEARIYDLDNREDRENFNLESGTEILSSDGNTAMGADFAVKIGDRFLVMECKYHAKLKHVRPTTQELWETYPDMNFVVCGLLAEDCLTYGNIFRMLFGRTPHGKIYEFNFFLPIVSYIMKLEDYEQAQMNLN